MPSQSLGARRGARSCVLSLNPAICTPSYYRCLGPRGVITLCYDFKRHHARCTTCLHGPVSAPENTQAKVIHMHQQQMNALIGHPTRGRRDWHMHCHSFTQDTAQFLVSVDKSVYSALASCLCTLCAVQLSKAWQAQPGSEGSGVLETLKVYPMQVTTQSGKKGPTTSFQSTSSIDWGNPTEADMWFAAEEGVSSTTAPQAVEKSEQLSAKDQKRRSWLPQWHLQGLHKMGRKAVITSCMDSLREIVTCMPLGSGGLSNQDLVRLADAMVAVAACNACQKYMAYVPECLFQATAAQLRALVAQGCTDHSSDVVDEKSEELRSPSDSTEISRSSKRIAEDMANWLWLSLQCVQADTQKGERLLDQQVADGEEELVFPGLATGKGTAHALMLQCLLSLRGGQAAGRNEQDSEFNMKHISSQQSAVNSRNVSTASASDSSIMEEPAHDRGADNIQHTKRPIPVDNDPSVHTSNGVELSSRTVGAQDVDLPSQIFRNVPAILQDMALCSAEACAAAYMEDVREGNVPNSDSSRQRSYVGDPRSTDAPLKPGWTSQAAMVQVPALLDVRLGSTRELERFRNHLAIATAVRQNYGSVRDMYEDRFTLQGVRDGYKLVSRSLFIRRAHELNALQGWKARLSTAMELGDVVAPIFVRILQRLSSLLSWLLVSMVGGGLGLIYKGIRQSMSGNSSKGVGWDMRGRRTKRGQENDDQDIEYSFDFL